ncbi:hypothetical protein DPMN_092516 [Dreissena polymorpha]|uniref:Uncharacterized protein n=1 Tax=Dreissena polymorpha TaxID=45954 RepID=A0A9D4R1R7_DREPO|nr:hypothetical protein DPMN_092516 [Dreissena polymorpha]
MRFSVKYLEAEVTKRETLIGVLKERLRKSSEAAIYFDQFDGSNFDEYRQKMLRWQQDDIELLKKSKEIKKEFVLKNGRLLFSTLMWALTAIANLPNECIHKTDFNTFLSSLRIEAANIIKEMSLGRDQSVKETIQQIEEYIKQRNGNCIHANELKDIALILQNAILGDYTGIQRDVSFTEGEVNRTTQRQTSTACTLL